MKGSPFKQTGNAKQQDGQFTVSAKAVFRSDFKI
jgi:hypothetical protein